MRIIFGFVFLAFAGMASLCFADSTSVGVTNVFAKKDWAAAKHFYDASYWARMDTGICGEEGAPLDAEADYLEAVAKPSLMAV